MNAAGKEPTDRLQEMFIRLKVACRRNPMISYKDRIDTLKKIESIIIENDDAIADSISEDFGYRSPYEVKNEEIMGCILGLRHTRKKLKAWMKPRKRKVSLAFFGAKNKVAPQAKGVVGIVTPWNYPLYLSIGPLTDAVAAGNRVMIKLASNSQNLCRLMQRCFLNRIPEDRIAFMPGVPASDFSALPFDHLLFTGSTQTGRQVMQTAAANLTPVTLELGGKSPVVLTNHFDLNLATQRIMHAKLLNAGQTCVAPDHLYLPENLMDAFVDISKKVVSKRFSNTASPDYTSIIDDNAFERLNQTIADAEKKGAEIIPLLPDTANESSGRKFSPMLIKYVSPDMLLMRAEIFGPILPILTYNNLSEVIDTINCRERPLALYIFSNDKEEQDTIIANTISGGVGINDCIVHVAQNDLPFGGIGNSGMGQYHGYEGFLEFSKIHPIFKQAPKAKSLSPPYGKEADKAYAFITKSKWLS